MPMIIQCPFYKMDSHLKLYCEGCSMKFPDMTTRRNYIENYCANHINWQKCSVAHSMQCYYDRKDEE